MATNRSLNVPVLVTNGWIRTTYCVMESLAKRGISVHVVDRSNLAMCRFSRWARSFHRVPNFYSEAEAYARAIADIAGRVGAGVLMPTHEDIITLAQYRDLLPSAVKFVHAPLESLRAANDKWKVMNLCRELKVPCADSFVPESMEDLKIQADGLDYPVVIKTRTGNSGKGVFFALNREDLISIYAEVLGRFKIPRKKWPMVQEYLGSDVWGVCMIYDRGRMIASTAEKYLRCKEGNRFGTSTYRVSSSDPKGVGNCRKIADSLNWHGVIHFDLIKDPKTGVGKITEINPRFWGGIMISVASGMDFPLMLHELAVTGKICHPPTSYRRGVHVRWILGELIGLTNLIKKKSPLVEKAREFAEILLTPLNGTTDDLRLSDPIPFVMEAADYLRRFWLTGSSNPAEEGMVT